MLTLKDYGIMVGSGLLFIGVVCLPARMGVNPQRDLSRFNNFADLGTFLSAGLVLIAAGLFIISLTLLSSAVAGAFHRAKRRSGR